MATIIIVKFEGLSRVIAGLHALQQPTFMAILSHRIATQTEELTRKNVFEGGRDPYNNRWARWARNYPESRKKLVRSEAMKGSVFATGIHARGFNLGTHGVGYACYHQKGVAHKNLPRRAFLPDKGLPPTWVPVYQATFAQEVLAAMGE